MSELCDRQPGCGLPAPSAMCLLTRHRHSLDPSLPEDQVVVIVLLSGRSGPSLPDRRTRCPRQDVVPARPDGEAGFPFADIAGLVGGEQPSARSANDAALDPSALPSTIERHGAAPLGHDRRRRKLELHPDLNGACRRRSGCAGPSAYVSWRMPKEVVAVAQTCAPWACGLQPVAAAERDDDARSRRTSGTSSSRGRSRSDIVDA